MRAIRSTTDPRVRPQLVVEVKYPGWSGSGRLCHSVFLGIQEDA
jgi:ATP-dependent DNA ligase